MTNMALSCVTSEPWMVSRMDRLATISRLSDGRRGDVLTHAVEQNDGVLEGESNHGQDGCQEQRVHFPTKHETGDGGKAQNDEDVVEQSRDSVTP